MRSYPPNSPEAAARIVALVLIPDGHVCSSEFDALKRLDAERELGLEPQLLPHIVHTLCEELMMGGYATGSLPESPRHAQVRAARVAVGSRRWALN